MGKGRLEIERAPTPLGSGPGSGQGAPSRSFEFMIRLPGSKERGSSESGTPDEWQGWQGSESIGYYDE